MSRRIEGPISEISHLFPDPPSTIRHGQKIYDAGNPAKEVILLTEGYAAVSSIDRSSGNKVVSEIAKSISVLGSDAFAGNKEYTETAEALTDCRVSYIPYRELTRRMQENPEIASFLMISQEIRRESLTKRVLDLSGKLAVQQVARTILDLKEIPNLPLNTITFASLAEFVGCSKEMVAKAFRYFNKNGLTRWDRRTGVEVLDRPGLLEVYENEAVARIFSKKS